MYVHYSYLKKLLTLKTILILGLASCQRLTNVHIFCKHQFCVHSVCRPYEQTIFFVWTQTWTRMWMFVVFGQPYIELIFSCFLVVVFLLLILF